MRTQGVRTGAALGCLLALGAAAGGCGSRTPAEERLRQAARSKEIRIAAAWPWEARKEIRYREGLEMAVAEVNAEGGVTRRPLRLMPYDDKESVDEGRLVAQRIGADPEVVAVIGHLQSYVTVPAAAIYDFSGLVLVAPTATDPELTAHGYKRVFRATFSQKAIGGDLADFAADQGLHRVAIEYIRNTYGRSLANAFEERASELGITIVARQSYDPSEQASERTFGPTLQEWKQLELDAIFLAGEVPSAAIFVAQARAAGIKARIIGGDAMSSPGLMSVAGNAAEGMIVASFFHPDEPRPEVRRFVEAFAKRYGVPPDAGSALGYDAVRVLAHAMQQAGSSAPDDVARALHQLDGWPGVTGSFAFDERGDMVHKRLVKMLVRNGRFEYVSDPAATWAAR